LLYFVPTKKLSTVSLCVFDAASASDPFTNESASASDEVQRYLMWYKLIMILDMVFL
jgi:hypothetical protein